MKYADAIKDALTQKMREDERVFICGLGVPDPKGVFGTTAGLLEEFGEKRVFDTPACENTTVGMMMGAAQQGLHPVMVSQRVDFMLLSLDQIINHASKWKMMFGGKQTVPFVLRMIVGRGWGQAAQHSKSMHSVFAHLPGLKVVMPATPNEARGMLISAIRDDNPVISLEHRWLYDVEGAVDDGPDGLPLEESVILREGRDATVVATSWMNVEALRAAEILARRGVEVEIVNARCAAPFDPGPVIESCARTRHCVVADNDWLHCGFSAEIAARVMTDCFDTLEAPVTRIGWAETPCPTTRCLEDEFYPNAVDIIRAIERQLDLEPTDLEGEEFFSYENKFRGPF